MSPFAIVTSDVTALGALLSNAAATAFSLGYFVSAAEDAARMLVTLSATGWNVDLIFVHRALMEDESFLAVTSLVDVGAAMHSS